MRTQWILRRQTPLSEMFCERKAIASIAYRSGDNRRLNLTVVHHRKNFKLPFALN